MHDRQNANQERHGATARGAEYEVESRDVGRWMSTNIYRGKDQPGDYWISAVFRDESSYRKNADDPIQDQWFREQMSLLESDPEWHDGEIIHSAHTH